MEELKKRKKYLILLLLFFLFLFICFIVAKGIYSSGLAQVEVNVGVKRSLLHTIRLNGRVSEGQESAVYILNGLRVNKIYVRVGDRIHTGDVLFQIDTQDLAMQMEAVEQEINQLNWQITDLKKNQQVEKKRKELQMQRAKEDYDNVYAEGTRLIQEAANALQAAKNQLELHKNNKPAAPADTVSGSDLAQYQQAVSEWEAAKRQLEEQVNQLAIAKQDTERTQNNTIRNAARNLEDANLPSQSDSILKTLQVQLENRKKVYEEYKRLMECEGKITISECSGDLTNEMEGEEQEIGILTALNVRVGERTMDSAAAKIMSKDEELIFKASFEQGSSEYQYIGEGDEGEIQFNRNQKKMKVNIDYLRENETMSNLCDVLVLLEGGNVVVGESGVLTLRKQSESYACCIPVEALHMDDWGDYFVYVLNQKNSILGMQYVAAKVRVNVLDKNETYAAIESVLIDEGTEIIRTYTKDIQDGTVVRYKE